MALSIIAVVFRAIPDLGQATVGAAAKDLNGKPG